MNVLLIYPRNPDTFWSFKHVLKFVSKKAAFPPLGLLTVAAMLPRSWALRLVDMNVSVLTDAQIRHADYVLISGMIVHKQSATGDRRPLLAKLGKTVIAGGPLFTTGYKDFPEIPHFVVGEAEDVIAQLVADMQRGALDPIYRAPGRPDVRHTPVPRWDLIRLGDYVTMPVQFSRGCPFDCEFCDIVVMNGRVPRTKDPEQLVCELEALRLAGWKRHGFHRRRQFHRRTQAGQGAAAGPDRLAPSCKAHDGLSHRSVSQSRRPYRSVVVDGGGRLLERFSSASKPRRPKDWRSVERRRTENAIWRSR